MKKGEVFEMGGVVEVVVVVREVTAAREWLGVRWRGGRVYGIMDGNSIVLLLLYT